MGAVSMDRWADFPSRWRWEAVRHGRRLTRWGGGWSWVVLGGLLCCAGLLCADLALRRQVSVLVARSSTTLAVSAPEEHDPEVMAAAGLAAFEQVLLPYENVPMAIDELLTLAQGSGLSVPRVEYRAQPDNPGQFLKIGMTWPIRGQALAVHQFIGRALMTQRSLAVESVQFKRAEAEPNMVEAKVQWALLTRLPPKKNVPSTLGPSRGAVP